LAVSVFDCSLWFRVICAGRLAFAGRFAFGRVALLWVAFLCFVSELLFDCPGFGFSFVRFVGLFEMS
jgi:hypothetical protein